MSWLSVLTGAPKVVDMVSDTVKSGMGMLDNWKFTDEEKAKHGLMMTKAWLEIQKTTASENSIRSVTRRILAWGIIGTFLSLVGFASMIYKWNAGWAVHIKQTIMDTQLGWLVISVGFFYFGYYGASALLKKKKG